ncbi:MAG: hypothetical protein ACREJ2_16075 [Planctomycetota bacterium]
MMVCHLNPLNLLRRLPARGSVASAPSALRSVVLFLALLWFAAPLLAPAAQAPVAPPPTPPGTHSGAAGGPTAPTRPGGVHPPPPGISESGGRYVKFQVSVFPPFQAPGSEVTDDSESMGKLAGGKAYCRRGYYLPLVVNFYNQSQEPFDVVVQCEINGMTFDARRARRAGQSHRILHRTARRHRCAG